MEEASAVATLLTSFSRLENVLPTSFTSRRSLLPLVAFSLVMIATLHGNLSHHFLLNSTLGSNSHLYHQYNQQQTFDEITQNFSETTAITTNFSHVCAPWLKNRKILFDGVETMNQYYRPGSRGGGENYVFAALDWALRENGFDVVSSSYYNPLTSTQVAKYYRIFRNGPNTPNNFFDHDSSIEKQPEIRCKTRYLHFWGNWFDEKSSLDPRQILSPYPEDLNTFVGYTIHSLLWETEPPSLERSKQGFIVGRRPDQLASQSKVVIQALMDDGFTLHTICRRCKFPPGVVLHKLGPKEYASLMGQMAFLIGFGDPLVSPSPLEGLAHGAAWLNPLREVTGPDLKVLSQQTLNEHPLHWKTGMRLSTQHNPLALMGRPYVYNIDLANASNVLEAAQSAVQHRFVSYTPWEFRPEALVARACAMMEDDSICQCQLSKGKDSNSCSGSSYVRNPTQS